MCIRDSYTSDASADGNATDGIIQLGDDVTFTITVINQGTLDAGTFEVTDFLPPGFVLNDPAWTDNGDGTAVFTGGALTAGDSVDIDITMAAATPSAGQVVNWAEISSDDGNDIDSTPDTDPADDNQPAAPGDPTDDVTDNTAGDEDDHDPAPVTVDAFDLALTKVYTSDTFGDATDGIAAVGADTTFTITVTNQGTADASNTQVTDFIPAGFVLNDPTWTDNGDGTASTTIPLITAGSSAAVTIVLQIVDASAGVFENLAEISSDNGPDVDSTPNSDPTDDGAPVDNVTDNTGGDEDDHDPAPVTVVPVVDLALIKQLDEANTTSPVSPGDQVGFTITITNQGLTTVDSFSVIDFVDLTMWDAFDPAANPAGVTGGDVALPFSWAAAGTDGLVTVAGNVAAGESVIIPVTLTIAEDVTVTELFNTAEITELTAINPDGTSVLAVDVDSTPDAVNDDPLTDDVVDNAAGDEDDHDIATIILAFAETATPVVPTPPAASTPPPASAPPLAVTGQTIWTTVLLAFVLVMIGLVFGLAGRRREDEAFEQ